MLTEKQANRLRLLARARPSNFFMDYLLVMSDSCAIFMTVLGEMACAAELNEECESEDDWFRYSVEDVARRTWWSESKQLKLLQRLKAAGFVSTKRQGKPPFRMVRINREVLVDAIVESLNGEVL